MAKISKARQQLMRQIKAHAHNINTWIDALSASFDRFRNAPLEIDSGIDARHKSAVERIQKEFNLHRLEVETRLGSLLNTSELSTRPWSDSGWRSFDPSKRLNPASGLCIGTLSYQTIQAPALLTIIGNPHGNLLFRCTDRSRDLAISSIGALMLRIPCFVHTRFLLFDPIALGNSFTGFLRLESLVPDGRARIEESAIKEGIQIARNEIEQRTAKMGPRFTSFEAFLDDAKQYGLFPYYFLVVADFPAKQNRETIIDLLSIAANGIKRGVYLILLHNLSHDPSYGDFKSQLRSIEEHCTIIADDGHSNFTFPHLPIPECTFSLERLPSIDFFTDFSQKLNEQARQDGETKVDFARLLPDRLWMENSQHVLRTPIGIDRGNQLLWFEISDSVVHTMVAGATGKGKSTLLHNIIINLAHRYSPDELELYLIDGKEEGVEFNLYAETLLPQVRVVSLHTGSVSEFAGSVFEFLQGIIQARAALFTEYRVASLAKYREVTHSTLPRILLIIDEIQRFFMGDEKEWESLATNLFDFATIARSFGVHMILATQSPRNLQHVQAVKKAMGQIGLRIAFNCERDDSRFILSEDNTAAADLTSRGAGIYNSDLGHKEHNVYFQSSYLPEDQRALHIARVLQHSRNTHHTFPAPIVIDGQTIPTYTSAVASEQRARLRLRIEPEPLLWLGEPLALTQRTAIRLERRLGCNICLLGVPPASERGKLAPLPLEYRIANSLSLSLILQQPEAQLYIVDTLRDNDERVRFYDFNRSLYNDRIQVVKDGDDPLPILKEVRAQVEARLSAGGNPRHHSVILLMVLGVQNDFRFRKGTPLPSEATQVLLDIADRGPLFGIHIFLYIDAFSSIPPLFDWLKNEALFKLRIAVRMDKDSAQKYLGSNLAAANAATSLVNTRALLLDQPANAWEIFRPYLIPAYNEDEFFPPATRV